MEGTFLRIPFVFKPGALEAAYVDAVVESETLHIYATVEFLVDTGATKTTISDKDAIRLGIDYETLEKHDKGYARYRWSGRHIHLKKCTIDF